MQVRANVNERRWLGIGGLHIRASERGFPPLVSILIDWLSKIRLGFAKVG